MKIGIIAGEASGDILGAGLLTALKESNPDLQVSGIAGPKMMEVGCEKIYNMESLSMMGFVDPLLHLPELIKIRRGIYKHFLKENPDVFIGIDSPGFNLGLELKLHQAKIPVVHYVSPSVWAWGHKRIFKIAKAVDLMLTLFPFEEQFYKSHNIPVCFVGHPLADQIPLESNQSAARKRLELDQDKIYIAILPGSRASEIKHLAKLFITVAYRCWKLRPQIEFITSAVNAKRFKEFQNEWRTTMPQVPIKFFQARSHDVMEAANVVLVGSGTATLETMLYKRPMVIAYRLSSFMFQVAKRLVKVPFIGLPNLLANEKLVPEFIQSEAKPEALTMALLDFIDHPEKVEALQKRFTELHLMLKRNASQQAAEAIQELIKMKKSS